jgi:transposase-like protein
VSPINDEAVEQVRSVMALRVEAEAALARARSEEQRVIRLVHLGGASVREIARALGLSHQRVQQIVDAAKDGRGWKRKHKPSSVLVCTFCAKDADEVAKVIAGPGVYICNECVGRARRGLKPHTVCSFCGKSAARDLPVRGTDTVAICSECLDLCNEIIAEEAQSDDA